MSTKIKNHRVFKKYFDVAILDYSKTFETVPHDAVLNKIKHYDCKLWKVQSLKRHFPEVLNAEF